jgi:16S rRNA (uracil1498-N3)-methyltransferase
MRLHRFYRPLITERLPAGGTLTIDAAKLVHQWLHVLRYTAGDTLVVFGAGYEYTCTIGELNRKQAVLTIESVAASVVAERRVAVGVALLKREKLEWVVEKATELGCTGIVLFESQRSERRVVNMERLLATIVEAAEQCGRGDIPELVVCSTLAEVLDLPQYRWQIAEQGSAPVAISKNVGEKTAGILVGPEGGWSESEQALCMSRDITPVGMGQFTLRAETAAVAAAVLLG